MTDLHILEGGLDDPRVIALVEQHVAAATATLPPQANHAAAVAGLKAPGIRFFTARRGDVPLGIGALKRVAPDEGEVKSMFTAPAARGLGVGAAILRRLVEAAREAGMARISLATHPFAHFAAAVALYRRHGFADCQPFAGYAPDPATIYLSREL